MVLQVSKTGIEYHQNVILLKESLGKSDKYINAVLCNVLKKEKKINSWNEIGHQSTSSTLSFYFLYLTVQQTTEGPNLKA